MLSEVYNFVVTIIRSRVTPLVLASLRVITGETENFIETTLHQAFTQIAKEILAVVNNRKATSLWPPTQTPG